jgi:hypothetical protein
MPIAIVFLMIRPPRQTLVQILCRLNFPGKLPVLRARSDISHERQRKFPHFLEMPPRAGVTSRANGKIVSTERSFAVMASAAT